MSFGKIILEFRAKNNLSQQQAAEILHVSRQTINAIESDKREHKPSKLTQRKIEIIIHEYKK